MTALPPALPGDQPGCPACPLRARRCSWLPMPVDARHNLLYNASLLSVRIRPRRALLLAVVGGHWCGEGWHGRLDPQQ
jgi:hypothetical protein